MKAVAPTIIQCNLSDFKMVTAMVHCRIEMLMKDKTAGNNPDSNGMGHWHSTEACSPSLGEVILPVSPWDMVCLEGEQLGLAILCACALGHQKGVFLLRLGQPPCSEVHSQPPPPNLLDRLFVRCHKRRKTEYTY